MRDRKLRAEKLTYLLDPKEVAKIKATVEKPVFEHFHPTLADSTESEETKAERDMINDVAKSVYKDALSSKIKEMKDLQDDFERYLSIIFEDLVDKRICDELDKLPRDDPGAGAAFRIWAPTQHARSALQPGCRATDH